MKISDFTKGRIYQRSDLIDAFKGSFMRVVDYEEIKEEDFEKYSKPTDIEALKEYRGTLIKDTFRETRTRILESN